jgi:hypothetical protein
MAYFIFNTTDRGEAADFLAAGKWQVAADEPHREALAAGDLALIYIAAPERVFIGRAELASDATPDGVTLAQVEEWKPPVAMNVVLSRLDANAKAKADFDVGVVQIIEHEYETVVAIAAES